MAPESFESALDRLLKSERTSRRTFVGRTGSAVVATSVLGAALSACGGVEGQGGGDGDAAKKEEAVSHPKEELTQINFSNWPLYMDKKILKDFEKETGAKVRYREDINENTEFFGKVRQPLQDDQPIGRDLVALTDWMAARWVRLGYTEPLDKKNIPNAKNLVDTLANPNWDPGRKHSMPYQSGQTAIGYNRKELGEIKSMKELFNPEYKGKVTMFHDARDSAAMVLFMNGIKPEDATIDQILEAIEEIDKQNRAGQIRRFTGNDYATDLTKGNVLLGMAYSGDMIQLKADNPDLDFVIPEEGALLWSDNFLIPDKAEHPYGAEVLIDYFYDPEIAARLAEYVNYVSPVKGAQEILMKTAPKIASNEMIFPPQEILERCSGYPNLSVEEEQQMNEAFEAVVGA